MPTGPGDPGHFGEHRRGVVEVLEQTLAAYRGERRRRERKGVGQRLLEADIGATRVGSRDACLLDHRRVVVDAGGRAIGADHLGQAAHVDADAAADIEHVGADDGPERLPATLLHRGQLARRGLEIRRRDIAPIFRLWRRMLVRGHRRLDPLSGLRDAGTDGERSGHREQLAQHVGQDAAVAVVVDLDRRVDAQ